MFLNIIWNIANRSLSSFNGFPAYDPGLEKHDSKPSVEKGIKKAGNTMNMSTIVMVEVKGPYNSWNQKYHILNKIYSYYSSQIIFLWL